MSELPPIQLMSLENETSTAAGASLSPSGGNLDLCGPGSSAVPAAAVTHTRTLCWLGSCYCDPKPDTEGGRPSPCLPKIGSLGELQSRKCLRDHPS